MLILSRKDLESLLSMQEVIEAVEGGFRALAADLAVVPERLHLSLPNNAGTLLDMPAFLEQPGSRSLGTKVVSVFAENVQRGLEPIQAVYLLLDAETGEPLSLMDARCITGFRTAATSALATRLMATDEPRRVLIVGAGTQALFHIAAMSTLGGVESITILSRSMSGAQRCAEEARKRYGISCQLSADINLVRAVNLICTCTNSPTPLFDGHLLKNGTHINAVGSFMPTTRELDSLAVSRSRVIIDSWQAAGKEAGEIAVPLAEGVIEVAHIRGTLSDLVSGVLAGRESDLEITLFKSCGLAIEDLVTARLVYDKARAMGAGTVVGL
jgi:alanine dehydrogenase